MTWLIDESFDLAKRMYEGHLGKKLPHWQRLVDRYREAKARLISAINPDTGRLSFVPESELSPAELAQNMAEVCARHGFHWKPTSEEASSNGVASGSYTNTVVGVPVGTKLSRALAKVIAYNFAGVNDISCRLGYLGDVLQMRVSFYEKHKRYPTNEEFIPILVKNITDRFFNNGNSEVFVVSVNPLDMLMLSENTFFASCMKINGAYGAGPLQLLSDQHSFIVYSYREERDYNRIGQKMPYKLWRQIVYADLDHRSAYLSSRYGNNQTRIKDAHAAIARILARANNQSPTIDASWFGENALIRKATANHVAGYGNYMLGSFDGWSTTCDVVLLKDGTNPRVEMASNVPCAGCADGILTRHQLCKNCG